MASNPDFYAFPTGQSGLTPAVIPTGEGLDLKPLMTAIQQRMLNKYRADEINNEIQKMSLAAQQHESELQLKRDQFAAESDLRAAQTANYYAMAKYHSEAAKQEASGQGKKWEYEAAQVPVIQAWKDAVGHIDADFGTQDWHNQAKALELDPQYAAALNTDIGRRAVTALYTDAGKTSNRIATSQQTAFNQLASNAHTYRIPIESFGSLQDDVESGGNNVWQPNYNKPGDPKSGIKSRFAYVPKDIPNSAPVNVSELPTDPAERDANYRAVTIFTPQVKGIIDLNKRVSPVLQGQGIAPPNTYQQPQGQQPQQWVRDPTSGQLVPAPPTTP